MEKFTKNIYVMACLAAVVVVGGAGGLAYWIVSMGNIYTDAAIISADTTSISPSAPGSLEQVLVNVGDEVGPNTVVARVGNELLKTGNTDSVIVDTDTAIGTNVTPSTPVVQVIDPELSGSWLP